jgi:putative endonuclease
MKMFKQLYVYILECSDLSFYVGVTNDINRGIDEHNEGIDSSSYAFKRRPVKLVYWEMFQNYVTAIGREKRIKGWSRKKKVALIMDNLNEIKRLSNIKNIENRE